jgi:hypothetical protein
LEKKIELLFKTSLTFIYIRLGDAYLVQGHEVTDPLSEIPFTMPVEGVTVGEWYTIWIDVYENKEKTNKLSYGKQIVLAEEQHPLPDDY